LQAASRSLLLNLMLFLSAALTNNPRTRPVIDGRVRAQGLALRTTPLAPSEIFWRQLKFAEFDVSEMSLASLMIATAHGPTEWVALPVFTMRQFFHTTILIRTGAGIAVPADLRGKRVGVAEFQQTRAVWARAALATEFGVDARDVHWFMERTVERSHGGATGFTPPAGVRLEYVPATTDIGEMLLRGELDATLYYYDRRNLVDRALTDLRGRAEVGPLFADPAAEGRRYFAKTGIFPINHCVVVRRELAARWPWVGLNLYNLFVAAKELGTRERIGALEGHFELGLLDRALEPAVAADPYPYGLRAAGPVLETLARALHAQGLTARTVALDEIFATNTLEL
jgi:4,5-dihydroxyphthalate decarboxylase